MSEDRRQMKNQAVAGTILSVFCFLASVICNLTSDI